MPGPRVLIAAAIPMGFCCRVCVITFCMFRARTIRWPATYGLVTFMTLLPATVTENAGSWMLGRFHW